MTAALASRDDAPDALDHGETVIDVVFALAEATLPRDHRAALRDALVTLLPWLANDARAGVHPLATTDAGNGPLSHRARLVLRVPAARETDALALAGRTLDVGGGRLRIAQGRTRSLAPFATTGASIVATMAADDLAHQRAVEAMLDAAAFPRRFVCGRLVRLRTGEGEIVGASVVVHGLPPAESLRLQTVGLGPHRALGCGLFVPHKIISGLD